MEGVGVLTRANCHGAGEALRMIVWVWRMGGEEVGEVLVRWRHKTSSTSFSRAVPSNEVLLRIRSEMRSAWSSSRMLSSVGSKKRRTMVSRSSSPTSQLNGRRPTLKDDQALGKQLVRYHGRC